MIRLDSMAFCIDYLKAFVQCNEVLGKVLEL
jgi:hypothetical protein